jgi:hypothetical protein
MRSSASVATRQAVYAPKTQLHQDESGLQKTNPGNSYRSAVEVDRHLGQLEECSGQSDRTTNTMAERSFERPRLGSCIRASQRFPPLSRRRRSTTHAT